MLALSIFKLSRDICAPREPLRSRGDPDNTGIGPQKVDYGREIQFRDGLMNVDDGLDGNEMSADGRRSGRDTCPMLHSDFPAAQPAA